MKKTRRHFTVFILSILSTVHYFYTLNFLQSRHFRICVGYLCGLDSDMFLSLKDISLIRSYSWLIQWTPRVDDTIDRGIWWVYLHPNLNKIISCKQNTLLKWFHVTKYREILNKGHTDTGLVRGLLTTWTPIRTTSRPGLILLNTKRSSDRSRSVDSLLKKDPVWPSYSKGFVC
jgi:hypothetical protein